VIQRGAPQWGKAPWREVDLVAGAEQAVCSSIAYKAAHKGTQVRLGGVDHLRLWRVRQWPYAPEP